MNKFPFAVTETLASMHTERLESEFASKPAMSPQGRVFEMIAQQFPSLISNTPAILSLCEMYHQRKIRSGDAKHIAELLRQNPNVAHVNLVLTSDLEKMDGDK